jgi:prepilin-type N-terminal cleavage/methylation domain-containing protein
VTVPRGHRLRQESNAPRNPSLVPLPGSRRTLIAHGFTLIELLIVVVIIGVLAAVAAPQIQAVKRRAAAATLRQEMRRVSQEAEAYFATTGSYFGFVAPSRAPLFFGFTTSSAGYLVVGWHSDYPGLQCHLGVGDLVGTGPWTFGDGTTGVLLEGMIGGNTCK